VSASTAASASPAARFLKFSIVGGSGVAVNVGLLHAFTALAKLDYRVASLAAIECAIVNNFLWNYFWTWRDRKTGSKRSFAYMLFKYHLSSGFTALVVNWGLLILLTEVLRVEYHVAGVPNYHISNLIGIGVGTVVNFVLGHFWVFSKKKDVAAAKEPAATHTESKE
jgi:putative flippase GtrA